MNTDQVLGKKGRVLTRRNERRGKSKDARSILQEWGDKSRSSDWRWRLTLCLVTSGTRWNNIPLPGCRRRRVRLLHNIVTTLYLKVGQKVLKMLIKSLFTSVIYTHFGNCLSSIYSSPQICIISTQLESLRRHKHGNPLHRLVFGKGRTP